ncbi:unnamed protein product [Nesidiocoris tenuis]|uniref:P-type phospholipid transporter n=1 Tax=Nesidiocoris tenuis TaxID=355587 RepID=A0A6H5HQE3_9HEMI|nr:unnamed protein product [Nesidiocoris tenuis]
MYEGERPIAASSPKLKPIAKRKAKNSRHSVSLLDVSAVEVIPEVTSQKCESFSNETLTSVCKDSGYVRSESSFSAEDEPKASGKKLIDELKEKQILIDELQESNRGLRIRCADAENKIFELRVKCESHCDCCQKDPPPPNESDGRWNWRHSHVETQSKDFFNFRRNPFSNSFKFDETGREIGVARLNSTCPSRLHREAESSSSEELALPGIAYQHLQDGNEHQTAEDLSLSKVEWWQSELLSKKRPNRTANAHALKVQRSKSDLDGLFQATKVPESNSIGRPNLAKHGSLHRLHDYLASSTDDLKSKRFSRPSPFWSTSGSPSRNNSLSNLASSFAELSIEDVKTDRISKLTDSRSPAHRQPISDAQNDAENCIKNLQNLTCQPAFSKECQTEGDRTVASDRICCCQSRTQVPYVIIVPTAGCCASANQHIQDLHCWRDLGEWRRKVADLPADSLIVSTINEILRSLQSRRILEYCEIRTSHWPVRRATFSCRWSRMADSEPLHRRHTRSVSAGGNMPLAPLSRPSALRRTHQRAASHGQIGAEESGFIKGHNRVSSKTDFILPPGHREEAATAQQHGSGKGHTRQASRTDSIYTLRQNAPPTWLDMFISFILRKKTKSDVVEVRSRTVVPNHIVPPRANPNLGSNKIRTTKYTIFNFLIKNLIEQFHRVANLYFIGIVLLNWVPSINAFGKEVAMIPVMFVLGVTGVKDLFEDRRRHASDKRINYSTCRVYDGGEERYKKITWKEVRVGDIVHLSNNEVVPADVLLLRTSDDHGTCYLDTCNLDGESNLKLRNVPPGFVEKGRNWRPLDFHSIVEVDPPTTKLYHFHGSIVDSEGAVTPVSTENLLLRDSVIKNTDFVEGIVVYAGKSPKTSSEGSKPIFEAESPDELALVQMAYIYNCRLMKRTPSKAIVSLPGENILEVEILKVLPFDSSRKCMSVIVRKPVTNEIVVYTKGADSAIFPRLVNPSAESGTGIEDRLQEGVPETLKCLRIAGIVVWLLTGDKVETATNVALASGLFTPSMETLRLAARSKHSAEAAIHFYKEELDRMCPSFILDPRSGLTQPFLELTKHCVAVLCCRVTPLQKAYIVKVVKERFRMRTLAIGDGANDVSMIQAADVGVGISGQEGMQAVMASDFSIARFKFLKPLLLVHGHWAYHRLSNMVLYFFYKNVTFVFLIFWYQLYCGFSGTVMVDQMFHMLYNLFFTSLPPFAIGVYDRHAPEHLLSSRPTLYEYGRLGKAYQAHSFWLVILDSAYQSLAIFYISVATYMDSEMGIWEFGSVITSCCMFAMLGQAALETRSWTILHVGALVLSIGAFYAFFIFYNLVCMQCWNLPANTWVYKTTVFDAQYYLVILLSTVVALLPRFIGHCLQSMLWPSEIMRAVAESKRATQRGDNFLVSWSRSTSSSSIFRNNQIA